MVEVVGLEKLPKLKLGCFTMLVMPMWSSNKGPDGCLWTPTLDVGEISVILCKSLLQNCCPDRVVFSWVREKCFAGLFVYG